MVEEAIDPQLRRLMMAHPLLFRGMVPAIPSHIPPGWYELVDRLCSDVEAALGPHGCAAFEVCQIKQKFGTLRFYYGLTGRKDVHAGLISSGKAMGPIGARIAEPARPADDSADSRVNQLIAAACQASESICQQRGERAELRNLDGRWATLCEKDATEGTTPRK